MSAITVFANTNQTNGDGAVVVAIVFALAVTVLTIMACWRVYRKARKPGWAAIIPIYNIYVLLKVIGRPGWWLLLYFVPIANAIVHIVVSIDAAKAFRKSALFGVLGLWLFPPIGYLILGFGTAKYRGVPKR